MLTLQNLTKKYGQFTAVQNVDLNIQKGEFFCLLGPSGCGKTTVLRMIAGFEKVTAGSILLDGKDITDLPPNQRDVNTVFQNYALFPNMTVCDNISYGLKIKKLSATEIKQRVERVVNLVGLEKFITRMPGSLSGGQQQRVALARALVNEPSVLLLDEPLSALDKKISEQTRIELAELQKKVGITFIFVTHNQTEALALADRIAVMKEGVIVQCDEPKEIYERPTTRFVADFIGNMNFFEGKITNQTGEEITLNMNKAGTFQYRSSRNLSVGKDVIFCIRPERMKISLLPPSDYENAISGTIKQKIYLGDITKYIVQTDTGMLIDVIAQNYLIQLSNEFYDLEEKVNVIWSKTSGEVIYA
ncbi:MAG TPA: ABC transporter ATP-binding protein [Candidatus Cloacimonadota bacterium]|nr:ABC transporter ATP-binding protein [Candidatus Cloacimonadota bacterium]